MAAEIAPFALSVVALAVSLASATFAGARFFIDLRDRKKRLLESQPYFVLRPSFRRGKDDVQETWAAIVNEGTVNALDMFVVFAVGNDPESTIFSASAARLAPGEMLETTNPILNYASSGYPSKWDQVRIEVGYRLAYNPTKFVVTPVMGNTLSSPRRRNATRTDSQGDSH